MMLLNHHRNKILIYRTCLQNTGQASAHTWREVVFKQDTITDLKITILGRWICAKYFKNKRQHARLTYRTALS